MRALARFTLNTARPLRRIILGFALVLPLLQGCAGGGMSSPDTGTAALQQDVRIGEKQYGPSQQSQGGVYTVDPQLSAYVSRVGAALARASDQPALPYEFVVLNNSVPNAWALPGGKIAVNRGLLTLLQDEAELASVLGHEIVHAAHRHGARQQQQGSLLNVGLAILGVAASGTVAQDLLLRGAQLGATMVQTHYGRADELEADYYGMRFMERAGYDPQGAVRVQENFVKLMGGKEQRGLGALFASHPPSQERVDTNRRTAQKLAAGGISGREEYQRAIARLKRDQPAYEAYDKGVAAMNAGRAKDALAFSRSALKLEEREALFHELKGAAHAKLDQPADAIGSFNRAIALNQGFYRPYLLRGMLHLQRNNLEVAEQDLAAANALLPTAEATYGLGEIALKQGDNYTALKYFDAVARSESTLAPAARQRAAKLREGGYAN